MPSTIEEKKMEPLKEDKLEKRKAH
jgi:hypothetical protein